MERATRVLAKQGGRVAAQRLRSAVWARLEFAVVRRRPKRTFVVHGEKYTQLVHYYNRTWRNERAVEIPLAMSFLDSHPQPALEVGNVLANYGYSGHVVVDRYEEGPAVVNVDVVDYSPSERFGAIVVISTLEHIGWDENVLDPTKTLRAIAALRALLLPAGRMLVTCPLSYNPYLDGIIAEDRAGAARQAFLIRRNGTWIETNRRAAFGVSKRANPDKSDGVLDVGTSGLWVAEFAPSEAQ
jgi:hypothetical protein